MIAVDNSGARADTTGKVKRLGLPEMELLLTKRSNVAAAVGDGPVVLRYYKRGPESDAEIAAQDFPVTWAVDPRHLQTEGTYLLTYAQGKLATVEFHCATCSVVDSTGEPQPGPRSEFTLALDSPLEGPQQTADWGFAIVPKSGLAVQPADGQYLVQVVARSSFAEEVIGRIELAEVKGMYHVRYSDPLQERSAALLTQLAEAIVVDDLRDVLRASRQALDAVEARLDTVRARLAATNPWLVPGQRTYDDSLGEAPAAPAPDLKTELAQLRQAGNAEHLQQQLDQSGVTDAEWTLLMEEKIRLSIEIAGIVPRIRLYKRGACD